MRGRTVAGLALLGVVAVWLVMIARAPELPSVPPALRLDEAETVEPSAAQMEALKKSIEKAAKQRENSLKTPVYDGGKKDAAEAPSETDRYERWVEDELLRRAETGESIPSDGSFDPNEALDRLKAGEDRESVFGRPETGR